jgi:hypothetical protein
VFASAEIIDLSSYSLVLASVSEDEWLAHRALLADIDKASRGKLLWQGDLA